MALTPSRYNVVSDSVGDERLVFNTLTQNLIQLSEDEFRRLELGYDDAELKTLGYLAEEDTDEFRLAIDLHRRLRSAPRTQLSITIVPSLKCNFSCGYCYNGIDHSAESDVVAIDSAVEYVASTLRQGEHLHVTWYGGEPTLFMNAIERGTEQLKRLSEQVGGGYSSDILTNGSPVTARVGQRMATCHIHHAQVSVDWPLKTAERRLKGRGAGETLELVLRNINNIPDSVAVTVRVNAMPGFLETFQDFLDMYRNGVTRNCGMYLHRIYESNIAELNSEKSAELRHSDSFGYYDAYLQAKQMMRTAGIPQEYYPVGFQNTTCIAQSTRDLIFTPDGLAKKCIREVNGPAALSPTQRTKSRQLPILTMSGSASDAKARTDFYMEYEVSRDSICGKCQFMPICQSGCVKDVYEHPDDVLRRCTPWKFTLQRELSNLLQKGYA